MNSAKKYKICVPIKNAKDLFINAGFEVEREELSDLHFNEFEIVMKGTRSNLPKTFDIYNMEKHSEDIYICKCHWSTIQIVLGR